MEPNIIDIARATSILGLVSTLAPEVKNDLANYVAGFYATWANDDEGAVNFNDEAVKATRLFKGLLVKYPNDMGEMADAFCLAIRQEINRIEDWATDIAPAAGPVPDAGPELTKWFQALEQARAGAVVRLLWDDLPPVLPREGAIQKRSRALYCRHKLLATISLYQYARECYEANTPKSFARRPDLPSYYTAAPRLSAPAEATPPTLNTQNSDPRKDISLDLFLVSAYIKTTAPAVGSTASPSLDELAAHVGFYSPTSGMKYKVQTCKPARMAALIDGLEIYGLIGRLGADELISGIEARYGQRLKKSKRPEHDPNGTYLGLYKGVELRLKEWVSKRLIPDKKSR